MPKVKGQSRTGVTRKGRGRNKFGVTGRLTDREDRFVTAYLADPERQITRAAIAAGYKPSNAKNSGSYALDRDYVRAEIAARTAPEMRALAITAKNVLQGWAQLGFSNILDYVDVDPVTGDVQVNMRKVDRAAAGAITELTTETMTRGTGEEAVTVTRTKIKLADRRPALDSLARHLKLIGADDNGPVQTVRLIIEGAPSKRIDQFRDITPQLEGAAP